MLPRTSARLKERLPATPPRAPPSLKGKAPAHPPCDSTPQISTKVSASGTSRPQKKQKSTAATPNTVSTKEMQVANYARVKSRKGKLRSMTELPMDIWFEVFAELEPLDLLHLSRATKGFREMLVASRAIYLWKMAYRNLSRPPPIPSEINLRHFTNFLFGRHCQFCASVYGNHVIHWLARIRICRTCIPKHMMKKNWSRKSALESQAFELCRESYEEIEYIPNIARGGYILKLEYDQALRALQATQNDATALKALRHEQEKLKSRRREDADEIRSWWLEQRKEYNANMEERRKRRKNEVVQRIHTEGYGSELNDFVIWRLPGVKTKSMKEMNDQEWERIKPRLIQVLEYKRQETLRNKMISEFFGRIQQLSRIVNKFYPETRKPLIIPPVVHFARTAPFADLIKNTSTSQIADSQIQSLTTHMPGITTSWRESADKCLLDLLPQRSTSRKGKGKEISASRLELATSFFRCHWCREPISYPRILMHKCLRNRQFHDSQEEEENDDDGDDGDEEDEEEDRGEEAEDSEQKKSLQHTVDSVWNRMSFWYGADWNEGDNEVTFDDEASGFAQAIVKACGEDPDKVTLDQMNTIDTRVECLRCSKDARDRKRLVMNWTTAILHDIEKHFAEAPDEKGWLLINKQDTVKAKALELKLLAKRLDNSRLLHKSPLDTPMKRLPYAVRIN